MVHKDASTLFERHEDEIKSKSTSQNEFYELWNANIHNDIHTMLMFERVPFNVIDHDDDNGSGWGMTGGQFLQPEFEIFLPRDNLQHNRRRGLWDKSSIPMLRELLEDAFTSTANNHRHSMKLAQSNSRRKKPSL